MLAGDVGAASTGARALNCAAHVDQLPRTPLTRLRLRLVPALTRGSGVSAGCRRPSRQSGTEGRKGPCWRRPFYARTPEKRVGCDWASFCEYCGVFGTWFSSHGILQELHSHTCQYLQSYYTGKAKDFAARTWYFCPVRWRGGKGCANESAFPAAAWRVEASRFRVHPPQLGLLQSDGHTDWLGNYMVRKKGAEEWNTSCPLLFVFGSLVASVVLFDCNLVRAG